jgi:hypothetical protein
MLWMDALRAIILFILTLVVYFSNTFINNIDKSLAITIQLTSVYISVILVFTCTQFFGPSRLTLIGDIVLPEERAKASGLLQLPINVAIVVGPMLAPLLVFGLGVQWALIINAVSFLISFWTINVMNLPIEQPQTMSSANKLIVEFGQGLTFIYKNNYLRTILITLILSSIGAGVNSALNVFFVQNNLKSSIIMA